MRRWLPLRQVPRRLSKRRDPLWLRRLFGLPPLQRLTGLALQARRIGVLVRVCRQHPGTSKPSKPVLLSSA